MGVNERELCSIEDVARRTGLSVSAIRFYADEGVVTPTGLTEGGFRRYDVTPSPGSNSSAPCATWAPAWTTSAAC